MGMSILDIKDTWIFLFIKEISKTIIEKLYCTNVRKLTQKFRKMNE